MANSCFFKSKFSCEDGRLSTAGPSRIQTIIAFSKEYKDDFWPQLEEKLNYDPEYTIHCHRDCVSTYTSKLHLERHRKRADRIEESTTSEPPTKKQRRSTAPPFNFKYNCIFCGDHCEVEKDKKHPERWRKAVLCKTAYKSHGKKTFKESILDVCAQRNDDVASEVRCRISGALSDLHAANARYHVDCMTSFMSPKSIAAAKNAASKSECLDEAFIRVTEDMVKDKSVIYNSVQLFQKYNFFGGNVLSRRGLLIKIKEHFQENIAILTSPGLSSLIVFQDSASSVLNLTKDSEDNQEEAWISKISKKIFNEIKEIQFDAAHYDVRLQNEDLAKYASQTLLDLLGNICETLNNTLPSFLIANIISSALMNKPTPLQIALANLLREQKAIVNKLYRFGITCSYDEILRFKKSAAIAATHDIKLSGIHHSSSGLIQTVADNFDAEISSQNGKVNTHSLAMLITQPEQVSDDEGREIIPRISKSEVSKPVEFDIPVHRYQGPKTVPMPESCAKKRVLPLKVLCSAAISEKRAKELDLAFLNDVVNNDSCPEYNGYNTRITRIEGAAMQPKTQSVYLPLIDMPPSDPDTILTALCKAKEVTEQRGQHTTIFTSDQPLYKVAVEMKWAHPQQFKDVVLRLGGMHMLMSFVSAVKTLMQGSGLTEALESTFAGVAKMLSGKKFPQNVRALRLLVEELLRGVMSDGIVTSMDELMSRLEKAAKASKTSKLWVDCLIKPVFIMMMYVRAERESDWPLHIVAVKQMLPYFFGAGHMHYARYGLYYLRSMERLEKEEIDKFMKGEHVMRHVPGLWNAIWSDMFIETTFMRYGHGPKGIIGITLKPETLKTWALSLHICSRLEQDVTEIAEGARETSQRSHKEETRARILSDAEDRKSIREKLDLCIDPLDPSSHPTNVVNIVTGQVSADEVTAHNVVSVGKKAMEEHESKWPGGFRDTISKQVKTISDSSNHVKIGSAKLFDTTLIYSRVIGIQASSRELDLKKVLSYELAPVPTSLFLDSGAARLCKAKSELKKRLAKESSSRTISTDQAGIILDGSAILWVVHWPAKGTVGDFVSNFKVYIADKLREADVYLIFDRYREYSTKSATREARAETASRCYQLNYSTPLPPQKAVLTVSANKKQLMALICTSLESDEAFMKQITSHKLVVTGEDVPKEIKHDTVIERRDMFTDHEEADNIIAQQAVMCAKEKSGPVVVLADDTDVFVLLLYHYLKEGLTSPMYMASPIRNRSIIDIRATVAQHTAIIPGLLAAHALSGCDTVPTFFGIGKGTVLKILQSAPDSLTKLGDPNESLPDIVRQATAFIGSCYSTKVQGENMSQIRYKIWAAKFGNTVGSAPSIQTLPPSNEAFQENVKRAHLQTCIWKSAVSLAVPALDPLEYGYIKHEPSKSLRPVTVPEGVALAPDEVLSLIRCGCSEGTTRRCGTMRCSCFRARLSCTIFCRCNAGVNCCATG